MSIDNSISAQKIIIRAVEMITSNECRQPCDACHQQKNGKHLPGKQRAGKQRLSVQVSYNFFGKRTVTLFWGEHGESDIFNLHFRLYFVPHQTPHTAVMWHCFVFGPWLEWEPSVHGTLELTSQRKNQDETVRYSSNERKAFQDRISEATRTALAVIGGCITWKLLTAGPICQSLKILRRRSRRRLYGQCYTSTWVALPDCVRTDPKRILHDMIFFYDCSRGYFNQSACSHQGKVYHSCERVGGPSALYRSKLCTIILCHIF